MSNLIYFIEKFLFFSSKKAPKSESVIYNYLVYFNVILTFTLNTFASESSYFDEKGAIFV